MEPVLKWAGGKRQLLDELKSVINTTSINGHTYYEPFVGGGALVFDLEYNNVVINDSNEELVNVYNIIKDNPDELIKELKKHKRNHSKGYYYKIRELDRDVQKYRRMSKVKRAARIIYLNRTCYNGLYRVNSSGFNNVPIGRSTTQNPDIVMEGRIRELNNYLVNNNVVIRCSDFERAVSDAKAGDVVYFDPPYDYDNVGFNSYVKKSFDHYDLDRLVRVCDELFERGCLVVVSNNDTKYVRKCFSDKKYNFIELTARRYINCNGEKRMRANEVIIYASKNI